MLKNAIKSMATRQGDGQATSFVEKDKLVHLHPKFGSPIQKYPGTHILVCPSKRCPSIYLSIHVFIRLFQAVIWSKIMKNQRRTLGKHPKFTKHDGSCSDDVTRNFGFAAGTSQSASVFMSHDRECKRVPKFKRPMRWCDPQSLYAPPWGYWLFYSTLRY